MTPNPDNAPTAPMQDKDYADNRKVREQCDRIYQDVVKAFEARRDRDEDIKRYWDVYHCKLSDQQAYSGNSKIFVPAVRDAIEARALRFSNALFPDNGRFVECISMTNDRAKALTALLNHYVRSISLRETVMSMLRAGDVTGQYALYVGWKTEARTIKERRMAPVIDAQTGLPIPGVEAEIEADVEIEVGLPDVWVVDDRDLVALPATADRVDEADTIAIAQRVTKTWLRERKDEFSPAAYRKAMSLFDGGSTGNPQRDTPMQTKDAGIRKEGNGKHLLLYEVWTTLKIDGEYVPAMFIAMGPGEYLTVKKNPYWGQRSPIISAPVKKIAGSFWGESSVKPVEQLQYQLNDIINMGMDAAQYALQPIVMTDPNKNPRYNTMVMAMAAVWQTSPQDTQIMKFPPLWQDALALANATKAQIQESLGLNPAMLPMGGAPGRKPTQAQVAMEQAIAVEGIADSIRVLETMILTPLVERFFEYDQQFRDKETTIEHFGELGYEAELERVPPVQMGTRYRFVWNGTVMNRNAQRVQQMIAAMNVLRGIPPAQLNGRLLDIGPILDFMVDTTFGPRLSSRVLKSPRDVLSLDPHLENEMLTANMPVAVSPLDNDAEHMAVHHQAAVATGDPTHQIAAHIMLHQQSMQKKAAAQAPQGAPGIPGGAGPGVPGTPRPGAVPAGPRGVAQQPPGAIHPDQMRDPAAMPRKM